MWRVYSIGKMVNTEKEEKGNDELYTLRNYDASYWGVCCFSKFFQRDCPLLQERAAGESEADKDKM